MIITHKLEMDLQERGAMPRFDVVQGDANSRVLELTLRSGSEDWDIPEDAAVWMRYCKSDGTKGIYDTLPDGTIAWSAEGNVLAIALAPQMLTAAGTVLAQVQLVQGTAEAATFTIQIGVERNVAAGVLRSEDYVNMLQWMEGELDRLLEAARDSGDFDGPQGPQGPQGEDGPSVYEYAAAAGYQGSEEEFAEMLITPSLPLSGGTMTGAVDMGGQALTGLAAPVEAADAVTKAYVDDQRSTTLVNIPAYAWSENAPYTQTVNCLVVKGGDWIRMEPNYKLSLEQDLAMKKAFDCISYVKALDKKLTVVCLENMPEMDLTVYLEAVRDDA